MRRGGGQQGGQLGLGLLAHAGLDVAPLTVDRVELPGQFGGARRVVGQQAFDAQGHVRQAPGRVQARPERKAEVEAAGALRIARRRGEEGCHARLHAALAHPPQPERDQATVVRVQAHHVGHGPERDQVEQAVQPRLLAIGEGPARTQLGPQRQQHVEHHADTGQVLAREAVARLVRVDDHVGRRQQHRAVDDRRQVVVGDDHRQAAGAGVRDARVAGDAVVDGDQHVRPPGHR